MSGPVLPPAGWYPDPGGEGARWWDGYAWTEHTAPVPGGTGDAGWQDPAGDTGWQDPAAGGAGWQDPAGGECGDPQAGQLAPAEPAAQWRDHGTPTTGEGPRWRWDPSTGWHWVPAPPPWEGYGTWTASFRPAVDAERRLGTMARWAIVLLAAVSVASGAMWLSEATALSTYFHWFRMAWHDAQAGLTAPAPPTLPARQMAFSYLAVLCELLVAIAFLTWQHRAASAARWLGLPARHSPGWGVGFWFIPVANLWCPYQALRDCLPPGHPARRQVLACWLLYLAAGATGAGAVVATGFSQTVGIALVGLLAVLWIGVVVLGRSLVAAIGDAHRAIAGA